MFTGIVQGLATIDSIEGHSTFRRLKVRFPPDSLNNVQKGASIALNGTCLTVTSFDELDSTACFDVIEETLDKTNLGALAEESRVNFERAARIGDEIGGHLMSGHVHTSVEVIAVNKQPDNVTIELKTPGKLKQYLLEKGFVGLNGCSLTLGRVDSESFEVHLIPETLSVTTFGSTIPGDKINLEVDPQTQAIVDTVEKALKTRTSM